jgi:hypothetical protein
MHLLLPQCYACCYMCARLSGATMHVAARPRLLLCMHVGAACASLRFPRAYGDRLAFPCLLMKTTYIRKQVKHLEHIRVTYVHSHCNICNIQTKYLQHMSETGETFGTYTCNICVKTMQHPDRTFTTYNMKTLLAG